MSLNYNKVMLAGNLTRDPVTKSVGGKSVAEFGLAINRRYKSADGQTREDVTFVDVETWGRTADLVAQYLTKGSGAFIEGRLRLDTWTDKASGQQRSRLKVVADTVQFTSPKRSDEPEPEDPEDTTIAAARRAVDRAAAPARPAAAAPAAGDDEPPF